MFISIVHARRKSYLEPRGQIILRTIIKYCRHCVPVFSSIFPHVNSTICYNTPRMLQAAKPVHRVYLVTHPLTWLSRGIWPKKPELQVFPWIERFERSVQ